MRKEFQRNTWALVTGASSGMGLEYCRQLAGFGCNLLMVSNEEEKLQSLSQDFQKQFSISTVPYYCDLARPDAAREIYQFCQHQELKVEILVNNAGMFFFEEIKTANHLKAEKMLYLHTTTPTQLIMLFGEDMKQRESGYILNMSSICAGMKVPGIALYTSTKTYIRNLSKSLYFEYKARGVKMTVVCPGAVATPLYRLKPSLMSLGVKLGFINKPEFVVRKALKGLLRAKREVKPGLMAYYLPPMIAILPKWLIYIIWKRLNND